MADNRINIVIQATDKASGPIRDTSRSIDDLDRSQTGATRSSSILGSVAGAAFTAIKVASAAAVAGVSLAGFTAVKSAGQYEQSRIAFETMLGSAERAQSLMGDIAAFAKSTPFELPEVVTSTKQLLAFGYAQEELLPNMRKIGDLAAGLGVPVGQLATIFGQVKVAGRLMGQDLLQFTNNGVPMIQALSKVLNVSQGDIRDLVEKGKVGFSDVQKALDYLTGSGSQFGGMMEKQSQSFDGVVSNIKDGFGQILRAAVGITPQGDIIKNSLFDKIKDGADDMMVSLNNVDLNQLTTQFSQLGGALSGVFGILMNVGQVAGAAWGAVTDAFNRLITQLQPGLDYLTANVWPAMQQIGAWVGGQFKQVWDQLASTFTTINQLFADAGLDVNVLSIVLVALATPVIAAVTVFTIFVGILAGVALAIAKVIQFGAWLAQMFTNLAATVGTAIGSLWGATAGGFNAFRNNAESWARNTVNGIVDHFLGLPGRISAAINSAIGGASTSVSNFMGSIKLPGFASGTPYAPGGAALVGENGPEIVNLPRGSQVTPAWQTQQQMGAGGGGGDTHITITGNITIETPEAASAFWDRIDQSARLSRLGMAS